MIVSINQPAYLPWLGYFERIARSDLHIVLDHVQFEKNSFVNRNRIRMADGWQWLTVPVRTKGRFGDLGLDALEIDSSSGWAARHWRALEQHYRRAPFFDSHRVFFADVYAREWPRLAPLLHTLTSYLLAAFSIDTRCVLSSTTPVRSRKSQLVLELCQWAGADQYLSGALGRDYLDLASFEAANIAVTFQDFAHPTYPQTGSGFEPFMAAVDLLFNCGPDGRAILLGENAPAGREAQA